MAVQVSVFSRVRSGATGSTITPISIKRIYHWSSQKKTFGQKNPNSSHIHVSCLKLMFLNLNEPPHNKTSNVACAPSEDSDQPGNPPSLIRVFAVRLMGS